MDTLASMVLPDHASAAGAPDTSAGAILPLSAGVPAGHSTARGSHALILQAMAAVLLLACLAAHVAFRRLMAGVERERRRTLRTVSAADLFGQRKREAGREPARKGTPPLPGGAAPAEAGGHPAPETPELLYTPTQDRRSSRDLLEVIIELGLLIGCLSSNCWCTGLTQHTRAACFACRGARHAWSSPGRRNIRAVACCPQAQPLRNAHPLHVIWFEFSLLTVS